MRQIIYVFIAILLTACGGTKSVDVKQRGDNVKEVYLLVGEGGGFTGAYNEYILYPDARVEVWDEMEQESIYKGSVTKKEAADIFEKWGEIGQIEVPNSRPGNMNYRIGYYENGVVKTLRWSDSQAVDEAILDFFNSTYQLLRNAK